MSMAGEFFRNRLGQLIDLRHPLNVLAKRMPLQEIEASLANRFALRVRFGRKIECMDMFGPTQGMPVVGVYNAGRHHFPVRFMVSLLYFKHAFNKSDEEDPLRCGEAPIGPYFSG